jgi:biofilm PGA synthesis N-glycosyltransferase PgaC
MSGRDYCIITPVRNEADYLPKTIESVVRQSITPVEWIIVNDGSRDETESIALEASRSYPWVKVVSKPDRGCRRAGIGVMEAFYTGFNRVKRRDVSYFVKLDGDLQFQEDYFERCFEQFEAEPKLGIGGGAVYSIVKGVLVREPHPEFHVRGATKIYRLACWEAIGGLLQNTGWDTLDEVKANMLGWSTRTFSKLHIFQLRATGASVGVWADMTKNGRANYIVGYHPLFMLAKSCGRLFRKPYGISGFALFWGYAEAMFRGEKRIEDMRVIRYLRRQQLRRLVLLKSIWR